VADGEHYEIRNIITMSVKVFDRIEAITERPAVPHNVALMLASAGIPPGTKIPLAKLDAAMASKDYSIAQRLAFKAELARMGLIEL
jgi:hypothetical protein